MTIKKNLYDDSVLAHELFHAYQYLNPAMQSGWNGKISNVETEAHLAQLMFLKSRHPNIANGYFPPTEFTPLLMELGTYIDTNGQPFSDHLTNFANTLKSTVEAYHNLTGQSFSLMPGDLNIKNLQELSKGC